MNTYSFSLQALTRGSEFATWAKALMLGLFVMLLSARGFSQYDTLGTASSTDSVCSGDCFELTPNENWKSAAVWNSTKLDLEQGFTICFNLNLGSSNAGADGIAFVLHNDSRGTSALGGLGGYMGYGNKHPGQSGDSGSTITPSLAVEFDTYYNGTAGDFNDPTFDHISVVRNGDLSDPDTTVQADTTSADIEDGDCHSVCVHWDPSTYSLEVSFDGQTRVSMTIDAVDEIFGGSSDVYWGFTAATGAQRNLQVVCIESINTFDVCCSSSCPSLITNGDFSQGCVGFTGDLLNPNCDTIDGSQQATVGSSANEENTAWNRMDHTSGQGNFLIVDGPRTADTGVWRTTIPVSSGKTYCFEAFVTNVCNNCNTLPDFELRAGGTTIAQVDSVAYGDGWVSLCGTFVAPGCTDSMEMAIFMAGKTGAGNDAGIDDIRIRSLDCEEEEEDCCDHFSFLVDAGCTGSANAIFSGDPAHCNFPTVELEGFDCVSSLPNGKHGVYSLAPGEMRLLRAVLIDSCGDTICVKEVFASCPIMPTCCDGLLVERSASVTYPGYWDLYLYQNMMIPCNVYSVRVNGVITASGGGSPLTLSPPCGSGLYIGSVDPATYTTSLVEYLDAYGVVICSSTEPTGPAKRGAAAHPAASDVAAQTGLDLAPNPAHTRVNLSFELQRTEQVTIEVLDLGGRQTLLRQSAMFESGMQQTSLETSALANGYYLVRLSHGETVVTKPLIIRH